MLGNMEKEVKDLTVADVARMLGRTAQTVYLWKKNKSLPYILIGGGERATIRFRKASVLAWARKNGIKVVS
jgi:hypothetical protein